jgi:hypothetical protein
LVAEIEDEQKISKYKLGGGNANSVSRLRFRPVIQRLSRTMGKAYLKHFVNQAKNVPMI